MIKKILFVFALGFILIAMGCKNKKGNKNGDVPADTTDYANLNELPDSLRLKEKTDSLQKVAAVMVKDSVLTALTKEIFADIKRKNYAALDSIAHPQLGVRVSPYASVDPANDQVFKKGAFRKLFTSQKNKQINWGYYDGSGEPILLTPTDYFKRFVYDGNYVRPEKLGVNKVLTQGNSANNIKEVYKESDFTESYISESQKNQGLDWKSVKLIFKRENGKYYLVGIVHNEWTI